MGKVGHGSVRVKVQGSVHGKVAGTKCMAYGYGMVGGMVWNVVRCKIEYVHVYSCNNVLLKPH